MAFAGGGLNSPSARENAPGGRFFFCALLSLLLMYFDQRDGWGQHLRYALQAVAYPIQVAVGSPGRLAGAAAEMFRTRASLRTENDALQKQVRDLTLRTQTFQALQQENAHLRGLAAMPPPLVSKSLLVDVVDADLGPYRQRLVINHGDRAGLYRSQAVVDAGGLAGQLVRVGPWSAEVMLITDPEAAVPVQVLRSGERTIAVGTGKTRELELPDLPVTTDVKVGDLIVTSGLGGVFPAGIPVGEVIDNKRDPDTLTAHVRIRLSAQLDRSRQLLALWFNAANPAAPMSHAMLDTLPAPSIADPVTQPPAPAKPAAAAAATKPAPPARKILPGVGPHGGVLAPAPKEPPQ
ncbi:MAG TPA: rod shape-determining protein MreC [Steroidobacteraceae bacterium]|nr:rod shape-determining protein MreC [Steroidobacteraceae bacterium]